MIIRYRAPIAAGVFLCLLGAYVLDTILTEQRRDEVLEERRLILMTADEITRLRLVNPSMTQPGARQEMVFTRRDGFWFMDTPFFGPAGQNAMQVVLSNLSGAVKRHGFRVSEGVNLEDYGLEEPEIVIEVQGRAGGEAQHVEIHIGRASTTGRIYATIAGEDEIFTITDHLRNQMRRSPNEMRSWRLILPDMDHWRRLTIENAHGTFSLEKREEEQWFVAEPQEFQADPEFTSRFLAALGRQEIAEYRDDLTTDTLRETQSHPYMTLEVHARLPQQTEEGDGPAESDWRQRLFVGHAIPEELARVGWIPETDQKILVKNTTVDDGIGRARYEDFQQKSIFSFDIDEVSQLEIQMGRSRTTLARDADLRWRFAEDPDSRVDQHKADRLLYELAFVEALQFVTANPSPETLEQYQLAPPNRAFTITTGSDAGERQRYGLALGAPQDVGVLYALDQQTSHVVLIRLDGGPNQFMATKGSLMDRRLFPDAISWPARAALIQHHTDAYAFFFEPELGWATRLRSGEIQSLDIVHEINDLLLTLSEMRILRKVNPEDPDWASIQQRPLVTRLRLFGPTDEASSLAAADTTPLSDSSALEALLLDDPADATTDIGRALLADMAMEDVNRADGGVAARIGAGTYLLELRDADTVLVTLESLVRSAAGGP